MIAWWLRGKFVNLGLISSFRFSLCLIISFVNECLIFNSPAIESIHSRGQHPCKFMGTKEIFYTRKESQLPQDLFKTPIWPPWRHVNTLYTNCWYGPSYWPRTSATLQAKTIHTQQRSSFKRGFLFCFANFKKFISKESSKPRCKQKHSPLAIAA